MARHGRRLQITRCGELARGTLLDIAGSGPTTHREWHRCARTSARHLIRSGTPIRRGLAMLEPGVPRVVTRGLLFESRPVNHVQLTLSFAAVTAHATMA
jgi:hypothetical protein